MIVLIFNFFPWSFHDSLFNVRVCHAIYVIIQVRTEMFVCRYFVWVEFDELYFSDLLKRLDLRVHVLMRVTGRVDRFGCVCALQTLSYSFMCPCIILRYFTGIFYAVVRQVSMLFIDSKDSVCGIRLIFNYQDWNWTTVISLFQKFSVEHARVRWKG